jgi:membrane protein DedA with SNARE-associated domain
VTDDAPLGRLALDRSGEVTAAYGLDGFPFAVVVLALFGIVVIRAQATYWLGRGLAAGTLRTPLARRAGRRLSGPRMSRALGLLNRWGAPAVTFSFLTVGVQTMINGAAGLTRMPYLRYTAAMLPGAVAWAFIYATVGLTAFYAALSAAAGSPWAVALGVLGALVVLAVQLRRRYRASSEAPVEGATDPVGGTTASTADPNLRSRRA